MSTIAREYPRFRWVIYSSRKLLAVPATKMIFHKRSIRFVCQEVAYAPVAPRLMIDIREQRHSLLGR